MTIRNEPVVQVAVARTGRCREREFRDFVVDHRPALVRLATLLAAGDVHLAEDLVQVALTKLFVAWPRVRTTDGAEPYVRRILVNVLLDERRRAHRREIAMGDVADRLSAAVDPADGVVSAVGQLEDRVLLALSGLPPGMRAAVVLRHWLGYDVADCARMIGCSEGNVKSQTARGLDRLRNLLGEDISVGRVSGGLHE